MSEVINWLDIYLRYVRNLPPQWSTDDYSWIPGQEKKGKQGADSKSGKAALEEFPHQHHIFRYILDIYLPEVDDEGKIVDKVPLLHDDEAHVEGAPTSTPFFSFVNGRMTDLTEDVLAEVADDMESDAPTDAAPGIIWAADKPTDATDACPWSLRVPIVPAMRQHLYEMAASGASITMVFRRELIPGLPSEWVDANASRYVATIAVPLVGFLEPGVAEACISAPFTPLPEVIPKDNKRRTLPKRRNDFPAALVAEQPMTPAASHPYIAADTAAVLTVCFQRPLVPLPEERPRPSVLPIDLVVPRASLPLSQPPPRGVAKAALAEIVGDMAGNFEAFLESKYGDDLPDPTPEDVTAFFQHVSATTGLRQRWLSQLQAGVSPLIDAVTRTLLVEGKGATPARMKEDLTAGLYVDMHGCLREVLVESVGDVAAAVGVAQAKREKLNWLEAAEVAEHARDYDVATRLHEERVAAVANTGEAAAAWTDYGLFNMRRRLHATAEHCFTEALALSPSHVEALIPLGLLLLSKRKFLRAEVLLQAAVDADLGQVVPWAAVGFLCQLVASEEVSGTKQESREREAAYSITQALRAAVLQKSSGPSENGSESVDALDSNAVLPGISTVFLALAEVLLDIRLEAVAEKCLDDINRRIQSSEESADEGIVKKHNLLWARLYFQSDEWAKAAGQCDLVLQRHPNDSEARLLLGDVYLAMGRGADAFAEYESALTADPTCAPWYTYVHMGTVLLDSESYADARDAFVLAIRAKQCSVAWRGMGIAFYRLDEYAASEQALSEANILNNTDPYVWAYLTLLMLKLSRDEAATLCFHYTQLHGCRDAGLFYEIAQLAFENSRISFAVESVNISIEISSSCDARWLLIKCYIRLREFAKARRTLLTCARLHGHEEVYCEHDADSLMAEIDSLQVSLHAF